MSVTIPQGAECVRAFLPTKDFETSKRFYEMLGFEKVLDGEVAIFNAGSGGFLLTRRFDQQWAENCMMQLMVDDLDAWWAHIQSLNLPSKFDLAWPPQAPAVQPWGLRIAFVPDPSGVLWHIAQRRDGVMQDGRPIIEP
jgi:catechol 2,3-dioxygenase-like lactoylglutathione lyase family enzyme